VNGRSQPDPDEWAFRREYGDIIYRIL